MHGFINPSENVQKEQNVLAEVYFDEFVRRCFFQKVTESHSEEYVIHGLMYDICKFITKDECFCLEEEHWKENVPHNVRHLSIFQERLHCYTEKELRNCKKLLSRSVADAGNYPAKTIRYWCKELTSIQSLSLVKCNLKKLPNKIGKLKHLEYLDISFSKVQVLPKSFCSLYNLRYLNMEGCSSPDTNNFPEGSNNLVNLQIFYFPEWGMPLEGPVDNLAKIIVAKNLNFDLRNINEGTIIDKIENLKHINIRETLQINNLEVVPSREAAEEADLNKKTLINKLNLSWSWSWERGHIDDHSVSNEHHDEEVLEALCPYPNLRELVIDNYNGGNLAPSWLKEEFLQNLTTLSIWACDEVTNLENCLRPEHLPALMHLNICHCKELVSLPVTSFRRLKCLENLDISDCPKLSYPNESANAMVFPPTLKYLHLRSCGDLENLIPYCLRNLSSLERLILENFSLLVSIPAEVTSHLKSLSFLSVIKCENLQSLGECNFLHL